MTGHWQPEPGGSAWQRGRGRRKLRVHPTPRCRARSHGAGRPSSLSLVILLLSFFPRALEPQRSVEVENRSAHELGHIPLVVIQVLGVGDQEP
jgi:hypothetical protein